MSVKNKQALLNEPHIAPLTDLIGRWRTVWVPQWIEEDRLQGQPPRNYLIPWFDPCDGGINARALFLMEKPGPGPIGQGVEFVSQDNEDPTAINMTDILRDARVDRSHVVFWNAVPAWNGERRITAAEISRARTLLPELLARLPHLRVIVCVGRRAQALLNQMPEVLPGGVRRLDSFHPSMLVRRGYPEKYESIAQVWKEASKLAGIVPAKKIWAPIVWAILFLMVLAALSIVFTDYRSIARMKAEWKREVSALDFQTRCGLANGAAEACPKALVLT